MELFIILNPVGLFRTIIFIAVIYFVVRLFTRYVLPLILDKKIKDMQQKMHNQQKQHQRTNRSEGDVTIEHENSRNKNRNQNDGEYVDFEEVE
ncbi:MAG TPA: DUF4834 family protein [Tangfeifania sp.]|nr:DUF4834 family protein [Tangfeifania sp.]